MQLHDHKAKMIKKYNWSTAYLWYKHRKYFVKIDSVSDDHGFNIEFQYYSILTVIYVESDKCMINCLIDWCKVKIMSTIFMTRKSLQTNIM